MKKKKINSRKKGATYERQIAKKLSDWSNIKLRRSPQSGGWNSRGDITPVDPKDMVDWPFNIELKNRQGWQLTELLTGNNIQTGILSWWKQSVRDSKISKKIPVLIFTKNFDTDYICLEKNVFKQLGLSKKIKNFLLNRGLVFFLMKDFLNVPYKNLFKV